MQRLLSACFASARIAAGLVNVRPFATRRDLDDAVSRFRRSQAAAKRQRLLGLSQCHISPSYYATVSENGAYLGLSAHGERQNKVPTWKRGTVQGFSFRSRTRLLKLLSQCDRSQTSQSLFVTLTYPRSYPKESLLYKRHLDSFGKRLRRQFPKSSAIWKLEFQSRGAPHYHLIVLGIPFLARQWLARVWFEVVGSGDERHKKAGTQVARVSDYRRALGYASKYVAKVTSSYSAEDTGRFWGVIGRESLPRSTCFIRLERGEYCRLVRVLRGLITSRSKRPVRGTFRGRWAICRGDRATALVVSTIS